MTKRVAVIGVGPSGTAIQGLPVRRRQGRRDSGNRLLREAGDLGGLWNYTWRTGTDENGEPVHGSMYRYLPSNGPKEGLEFADYSFEEHFGRPIASYPPRAVLRDLFDAQAWFARDVMLGRITLPSEAEMHADNAE